MGVFFRILLNVARRVGPSQISVIAAGVAFYALLAVFPAIAAVVALAGLVIDPEAVVAQLETLTRFVPEAAAQILIAEAASVAGAGESGLTLTLVLGVGFAIYLSTRATTALIHGLNVARDQDETRGVLRYWGTVILLTAALVVGTAILFIVLVGTPAVLAFVPDEIVPGSAADLVRATRWVLLGVVLLVGLSVLYRFGPSGAGSWRWISAGAALAAVF